MNTAFLNYNNRPPVDPKYDKHIICFNFKKQQIKRFSLTLFQCGSCSSRVRTPHTYNILILSFESGTNNNNQYSTCNRFFTFMSIICWDARSVCTVYFILKLALYLSSAHNIVYDLYLLRFLFHQSALQLDPPLALHLHLHRKFNFINKLTNT